MLPKIKEISRRLKYSSNKQKLGLLVVGILLLSLPVGLFLINRVVQYRSRAASPTTADVCFQQAPCNTTTRSQYPAGSNVTVPAWLDADGNQITAVHLEILFDPTKVQLTAEVPATSLDSRMSLIGSITSMATANSTGRIAITEGAISASNLPSGVFKFIDLPFRTTTSCTGTNLSACTSLSVDTSCTSPGVCKYQIVNVSSQSLGISAQVADFVIGLTTPTPTPTIAPTPTSGGTVTVPLSCAAGEQSKTIQPCILTSIRRVYDLSFLNSITNYNISKATFQGRAIGGGTPLFYISRSLATPVCNLLGATQFGVLNFPYTTDSFWPDLTGFGTMLQSNLSEKFLVIDTSGFTTFGTNQNLYMCVGGTGAATPTPTTPPNATSTPIPSPTSTPVPSPTATPVAGAPTQVPIPAAGGGTLVIDPVVATKAPNEIFAAQIRFRTGSTSANVKGISAITFRVTYPYLATGSPALEVVDPSCTSQGVCTPATRIVPDNNLALSGNWAFSVNSVSRANSSVTVDFSAAYTSVVNSPECPSGIVGYCTTTETPLATIYFKAITRPTTNPITLTWNYTGQNLTSLTGMFTKTDPPVNILITPINAAYSIVDLATLVYHFRMQGVSTAITRNNAQLFIVGAVSNTYTLNITSDGVGLFSPNPSPVTLTGTPITSTGLAYDVFQKGPGYLRKRLGNITLLPGLNTAPTTWNTIKLLAGDFVDAAGNSVTYNVLNINDIGLMLSDQVYNQLTVPVTGTFLPQFDIDGNGIINVIDIAYVLSNYTQLTVPGD
ncbi:hypothetical protein A2627_03965 [Candidatus Woesebacteria bacterium RIFCSPHIGHO2_01_FULL_39_28]|uniref:Dockerin domain-containing protein n=1 Tax=Candidatus Woesebacteria bacterium RIFCSPHIGHO2_01_FULL_39_28 TaxID=1802496 RepID=A0A1F7YHV1_9BACT|nr:MAG: hypothetical protein A2627_03965 [Candidatus Woesebacteria bacterium RIFCSPHIGHO2_01_FULL_39_28]OGM57246.1 MAG: hypothetical protein A3A50_00525 [Candidatus Woesebacteria bacterium RIFCSPLOWO2_01_FULL_38_20]